MKRHNVLKSVVLSIIISSLSSSCGLIEKFKTPEQPTDSKSGDAVADRQDSGADDLFSKTMNETKDEPLNASADAPSNIATESPAVTDDIKSLEEEFSGTPSKSTPAQIAAEEELKQVKVEESLPEIKSEPIQSLTESTNSNAGKIMTYKVRKGETLMQIAFKIYGDISKWKEIKQLNGTKISRNSALLRNMELKYRAPDQEFVWNPEGTPYLIKNGETLGTISNSIYQTPRKWKKLWENNKPLIKNPNIIYSGFTLYYKGNAMANYVQPKSISKEIANKKENAKNIEEINIDQAISSLDQSDSNEIDLTKETQSAPLRDLNEEVRADEKEDEAITH